MIAAMREVCKCLEDGDYYVPEMLVAARDMQAGLSFLKPALVASEVNRPAKLRSALSK